MTVLFIRDKTGGLINSSYEWYEPEDERKLLAAVRPKDAGRLRRTFRQLREREARLNAQATPAQRAIGWGDHWVHFFDGTNSDDSEGVYGGTPLTPAATIYGRVLPLLDYISSEWAAGLNLSGADPEIWAACQAWADTRGGPAAVRVASLSSTPAELAAKPDLELRALMLRWGHAVPETLEAQADLEDKIEQGIARIRRGWERGWRYCAAYSRNYPQAELDDQHVAYMHPITAGEFAVAGALDWPPCTLAKLEAARAARRPLFRLADGVLVP
jgi:hypothetical protein